MSDEEIFWNYTVAVYERARESCLVLQDDVGCEVNLLLYCCWRGVQGKPLDAGTVTRIIEACADWRRNVVEPLRATRRWLKGRPDPVGAEGLRASVLGLELESEKVLQGLIVTTATPADGESVAPGVTVDLEAARRIAEANLAIYQQVAGLDRTGTADVLVRRFLSDAFAGDTVEGIVTSTLGAAGARDMASKRESENE